MVDRFLKTTGDSTSRNELQLMVSKTGDLILTYLVPKPLLLHQGSPETETSAWEVNV